MITTGLPLLIANQVGAPNLAGRLAKAFVGWQGLFLIVGALLAITFLAWMVTWLVTARNRKISNSPERLFKDLCTAHKLTHRERQLMTRLAQKAGLSQPASLFVEPMWWDAGRLGSAWAKAVPELEALRKRLFAHR
jgi:hypothetical protein